MNKTVSFVLGILTGAAGGSIATYYIYKNIRDKEEVIKDMDMEAYYDERLNKKLNALATDNKCEEIKEEEKSIREDEKIASNEGVKKYHHENGLESAYGSRRIFGEDTKPVKKEGKKVIIEISEQEFLNQENGYEKQTVDVWMSNDDEEPEIVGIWAQDTDNEEFVEKRFGKSISELLDGRTYDKLIDYCHDVTPDGEEMDDGIGVLYLKNDDMKTDFEFILHDSDYAK